MLIRSRRDPTYELIDGFWRPVRELAVMKKRGGQHRRMRAFVAVDDPRYPVLRAIGGGALTTFGPFFIPRPIIQTAAPAYTSQLHDAGTDRSIWIVECPKAGDLRRFEWSLGAITTFPTAGIRGAFYSIDTATGNPNTIGQWRDITSAPSASAWIDGGEYSGNGEFTDDGTDTGTLRTVARSEKLALVVENVTTTDSTSFNVRNLALAGNRAELVGYNSHFRFSNTGGTPAAVLAVMPCIGLLYDDGTYAYVNALPASALNTHTINSGTDPDEIALAIVTPPCPFKIGGAWLLVNGLATGRAFDVKLYSGTTAQDTFSIADTDELLINGSPGSTYFHFDADYSVATSETWRMALTPGAGNIAGYSFDVATAAALDALDAGQDFCYDEAVNTVWDGALTTRRLFGGVLVTAIDNGASAGGGSGINRARVFTGM